MLLAGPHAAAAFLGLASALGVLVRLDAIVARNGQLLPALAMFRRCAALEAPSCACLPQDIRHLPHPHTVQFQGQPGALRRACSVCRMLQEVTADPDALGSTAAAEPDRASAQLAAAVVSLEELLGGRGLFRRFLASHTMRGSASAAACSQASFLSAAAGILRRAWKSACLLGIICISYYARHHVHWPRL